MTPKKSKLNMTTAMARLRSLVWSAQEGDLLGSEDEVTELLGVSKPTVRQVARLLESEGLLRVRRGIKGGYFAARPSVEVIEGAVSAYLQMMETDLEELSEIAAAMWVIVVRSAARLVGPEILSIVESLRSKVVQLKDDASFDSMLEVEEESRQQLLKLIKSPYIELIFHINRISATHAYPFVPGDKDNTPEHRAFIKAWRKAKLLELESIADGDRELAGLAARHARNLFHKRLWGHDLR